MSDQKIVPERITKPIQLLAAWLAGLILVNGSFLGAAVAIPQPEWIRVILVLASVANVPLFLACLFLLQTKFRPEMQEDSYYARYLELNTGQLVSTDSTEVTLQQMRVEIGESNQRYIEMISGLDSSLKILEVQISNTVAHNKLDAVARSELIEVVSEVKKSTQALEIAKERATDASVSVQINDLLPDFEAIQKELWMERVLVDKTFGSTAKSPEVPKVRIIGFGKAVPIEVLRKVVKVSSRFGFDRIHYVAQKHSAKNVYIGSYIYRALNQPQPVLLTEEIVSLLNAPETRLFELINAIEIARA